MQDRIDLVASEAPALIIGHHPHIAQGVGWHRGVLAVHSLGNLAFDQERLETMLALLARVDMAGAAVTQLRLLPVYVEDFQPQIIAGPLADVFLRRIGEFSHAYGGLVYPYNGQGWVPLVNGVVEAVDRTVSVPITLPAQGEAIVDLRVWADSSESLARATLDSPGAIAQSGRDILLFGDFDDWDLDSARFEATQWDLSGSSIQVSVLNVFRGEGSLMSVRDGDNVQDSVIPFRNRIRVMGDAINEPIKDLTLFGYFSGTNAGAVDIRARYQASVGEREFGEESVFTNGGGTFTWRSFAAAVNMPEDNLGAPGDPTANARAFRLFIRHAPPARGEGIIYFDELAVISWEEAVDLTGASELATPHARDFLRVRGQPGEQVLRLVFRSYRPVG